MLSPPPRSIFVMRFLLLLPLLFAVLPLQRCLTINTRCRRQLYGEHVERYHGKMPTSNATESERMQRYALHVVLAKHHATIIHHLVPRSFSSMWPVATQ